MKETIHKIATGAIIILILFTLFLGVMNIYKNFTNTCSVGDDQCLQVLIDLKRSERDEKVSSLRKVLVDTENLYNSNINTLKGMFSTGYTAKQMQAGKKENILPELLSLKSLLVKLLNH